MTSQFKKGGANMVEKRGLTVCLVLLTTKAGRGMSHKT